MAWAAAASPATSTRATQGATRALRLRRWVKPQTSTEGSRRSPPRRASLLEGLVQRGLFSREEKTPVSIKASLPCRSRGSRKKGESPLVSTIRFCSHTTCSLADRESSQGEHVARGMLQGGRLASRTKPTSDSGKIAELRRPPPRLLSPKHRADHEIESSLGIERERGPACNSAIHQFFFLCIHVSFLSPRSGPASTCLDLPGPTALRQRPPGHAQPQLESAQHLSAFWSVACGRGSIAVCFFLRPDSLGGDGPRG